MRLITDHKLNGLNDAIEITAQDEPGAGGANHFYTIDLQMAAGAHHTERIYFQNGPIKESGFNGISNEALLAVVIDRMRGFQGLNAALPPTLDREDKANLLASLAPFACRENALALSHLESALMWLQKRTRDRLAGGVEGTNVK